jgi:hypothetical protein
MAMAGTLATSDYPEFMRTLGQWLDVNQADEAELALARLSDGTPAWAVRWKRLEGSWASQTFSPQELAEMSKRARVERRAPDGAAGGEWAICLRALGQVLSEQQFAIQNLRLEEAGFRVSGQLVGRYHSDWFGLEDLLQGNQSRLSERLESARRAIQPAEAPARPSGWRSVFRRPG